MREYRKQKRLSAAAAAAGLPLGSFSTAQTPLPASEARGRGRGGRSFATRAGAHRGGHSSGSRRSARSVAVPDGAQTDYSSGHGPSKRRKTFHSDVNDGYPMSSVTIGSHTFPGGQQKLQAIRAYLMLLFCCVSMRVQAIFILRAVPE